VKSVPPGRVAGGKTRSEVSVSIRSALRESQSNLSTWSIRAKALFASAREAEVRTQIVSAKAANDRDKTTVLCSPFMIKFQQLAKKAVQYSRTPS